LDIVTRHRWTRLKTHNYLCRKCGTGKRNAQAGNGDWYTTYHRANGDVIVSAIVPPCESGALTAERLAWLEQRAIRMSGIGPDVNSSTPEQDSADDGSNGAKPQPEPIVEERGHQTGPRESEGGRA